METRPYVPLHDGAGEVYLVTGGAGCLGRHLVDALVRYRPAAKIRIFDKQQSSNTDMSRVSYICGDLTNADDLMAACLGVTAVFHLASVFSMNRAVLQRVNIDGTRNLLDAAKHHGVGRVIFVSTILAVLNCTPIVAGDEMLPYTTNPMDPYMAVKAEAERMVMVWGELHGVPVCTLRPSFMFGNGDQHIAPFVMGHNAAVALLYAEERLRPDSPVCGQIFNVHDGHTVNLYELGRDFLRVIKHPNVEDAMTLRIPVTPLRYAAYALEFVSMLLRPLVDWSPPVRMRDVMLSVTSNTFSTAKAVRMLDYAPVVDYDESLQRIRPWLQKLYEQSK
ncbi:hypothetical protein THASP1DRAFT_33294 [Thamnocephalis sphaerospora]|uniref:3-beta hydroxysteroid dehydrogenase/isomerase domain-containing protein n=1 Tax=Thamnocephalis sphaerospora TaxID=78915 RepID=A0A4P9XI33_9FUNG|nr:hypothetical protein THASP1DRAFT_33294 [Thamnocephalis sphaerospora]|eukprot:RKP04890.1 hypothetical protein THASP1DRAFT_33294 [Thamnocephalis sphaerospora]